MPPSPAAAPAHQDLGEACWEEPDVRLQGASRREGSSTSDHNPSWVWWQPCDLGMVLHAVGRGLGTSPPIFLLCAWPPQRTSPVAVALSVSQSINGRLPGGLLGPSPGSPQLQPRASVQFLLLSSASGPCQQNRPSVQVTKIGPFRNFGSQPNGNITTSGGGGEYLQRSLPRAQSGAACKWPRTLQELDSCRGGVRGSHVRRRRH